MPSLLSDLDLLRRLVGFDSASRNSNLPIADFIADYLDRPGVAIARNPSPDAGKTNLVIRVGPEAGREGLVLSGHMDVVPADEDEWTSDPFRLTETDGRYVGRGACDMKGFLALAINRAAALDPRDVARPLVLLLTYDEELGTLGAKHFVETWEAPEHLPRDAIVGEPTSFRAVRLHKGYLKLRLTFRGRAAHSAYPHLGVNAIEPAGRAIVALGELARALERERPAQHEHFPEVPYAPLTVARVAGGVAINVVPDRCLVECGVRLLPGMASAEMVARVRHSVAQALGETPFTLEILGESPPMLLDPDAPIHRRLCAELDQRVTHSVSFATDAGWLQRVGLDCVIWGPGSIEVAHRANEYLPADEFARAGEVLERVVRRACG